MNKNFITPLLLLAFFTFGCGLFDNFKAASGTDSNQAAPTPTVSAASASPTPTASPTPLDKAALGKNLLAFGAGALVVAKTSEAKNSDQSARQLIDEAGFGWKTADGAIENQSVTLELPARTTLKTIVFDTAQAAAYDGRAAKDVIVEVSDESATGGFQIVLEATLKDHADARYRSGVDNQAFPVQREIAGRFVRYTAKNNNGSPTVIFTKEIFGYGEQEPLAAVPNVSGTYKGAQESGTYKGSSIGEVHLKQEGNSVFGCFAENGGILEGTIDGRVLTLVASTEESRSKNEKSSFVAGNVVENGKMILTTWWGWSATPKGKDYDRLLIGEKTSSEIGNCKHLPDLDGKKDVVKEGIEKALAERGKAILYGINFDFNSDVIKSESKPTLEKVVAILKEKSDWKMSIEGHTDNIGGEAFNQTLSDKRAASVKKYLTDAGIDAGRLNSSGYGLSKPIAPNNSEAERAQNRRVELVKQ